MQDFPFKKQLSTGMIAITGPQPAEVSRMFDIAERKNPKRAFLFVSKVLGRHIPVSPTVMAQTYRELAGQLHDLVEPVLFVGMAETAVGLAAGVYREASKKLDRSVLITSTRHPISEDLLCEFKENHSHATDHLIYWPSNRAQQQMVEQAKTIVLIDDEATTGNTFANLLSALVAAGVPTPEKLVTVTLTDWSGDALAHKVDMPVESISLLKGAWHWQPTEGAMPPDMPNVNVTARGEVPVSDEQNWGRLGMDKFAAQCATLGGHIRAQAGEKVLVLGSCEFVWLPFLLAERLEQQGADVKFSSLTRSPIALGHAVESVIAFEDNYGLGIPNFVYNVANQQFDRILLCVETPAESVDPVLLRELEKVASTVEIVTSMKKAEPVLPVALVDLDDTLFQTKRKMVDELSLAPYAVGAVDRSLSPRSFMTEQQHQMTQWLLATTRLIPVTARGSDEMSRVQIPFRSWQSLTHGAVIMQPNGEIDPEWQAIIERDIEPYQAKLLQMQEQITALFEVRNIKGWARLNYEYGKPIYLVMKHTDSTKLHELNAIGDEVERMFGTDGWYVHRNSNNIAWLPTCISKGRSVTYLLDKLRKQYGAFPVLGLGDSYTDMSFLSLCDWFGMPRQSQLSSIIDHNLNSQEK